MSTSKRTSKTAGKAGPRRPYRLVSADQHINEPPDLWLKRVPAKYKSRVPQMKSFDEGDAWIIEGVADRINFGMNACSGLPPELVQPWLRWDQVRKGGYVPRERIKEMDMDGVEAAIQFPTPRLSEGIICNPDHKFQLTLVQAYNDWLAEYVSYAPDRLLGMIWLPATGVQDAIAELKRCLRMPGMIGPVISCFPHGKASVSEKDDALWHLLADMDLPLNIHVRLTDTPPTAHKEKIIGGGWRNREPERLMLEFMWGGALDRIPKLKVVFSEVDCGWVPFFTEQVDNRYHRLNAAGKFNLKMAPSGYFERHFHYAFITDAYGIHNREAIGVDRMMWSDDYPHLGGDWPYTQRTLAQHFSEVPKDHRDLILAGNITRLYRLPGMPA